MKKTLKVIKKNKEGFIRFKGRVFFCPGGCVFKTDGERLYRDKVLIDYVPKG